MKEYIVNEKIKIKVFEDPEDDYIELYYKGLLLYKTSTESFRNGLAITLKEHLEPAPDAYTTVKEIQENMGLQDYDAPQIGLAMSKAGFKSTVTWLNNKPTRVYKGVKCKKLY